MVAEVLKPNVQELQRKVIALLEQVSELMSRASTQLWFGDGSESKYKKYQHEVDKERSKVENLELRMAIAAPMNAGKSTIINAIIGQELLPSCATAMTTLPTEIVFKNRAKEPILKLSPQIWSAFQEAYLALKQKIDEQGIEKILKDTAEYPHLADLLNQIHDTEGLPVHTEISGCEDVNRILTDLNHIIRLCSILKLSSDPLQSLTDADIPRIETPFWPSQQNEQSEKLGNLIIIDTPGPNEAGVSSKLEYVVSKQLGNSQLVLIVLDFTQLKAEAAEKIKEEVQKVIRTRGKKNLYVLVNKVDQRRKNDMDTETVRKFVANNLKLVHDSDTDRVFEISARRAFCYTNFVRESQMLSHIKPSDLDTANALAEEVLGIDWENELETITVEKLQEKAIILWKKSGFAPFLEKAINAIMEQVAPLCMQSALNLCLVYLEGLCESVQSRRSYIDSDTQKLKKAINELNDELSNLEACRKSLDGEVAKTKKQIDVTIKGNLEKLKTDVREQLNRLLWNYAIESVTNSVTNLVKNILPSDTREVQFEKKEDANLFANKLAESAKQIIKTELNRLCEDTGKQTEHLIKELADSLHRQTQPIIERAQERLKKEFGVHFNTDLLKIVDVYVKINNPKTESSYGFFNLFNVFLENLFDNFFIAIGIGLLALILDNPIGKIIVSGVATVASWFGLSLDNLIMKEKYTIKLLPFIGEVVNLFDEQVEAIEQEAKKFIEEYFDPEVKRYFNALDYIVGEYKNDLEQSQKDKNLPLQKLEELKQALDSFAFGNDRLEIDKLIKQANTFLEDTKHLLPQR